MRTVLDRLYLYAGYAAGAFMLAIFVLMMLLSVPLAPDSRLLSMEYCCYYCCCWVQNRIWHRARIHHSVYS